jgi:hypothetical protein
MQGRRVRESSKRLSLQAPGRSSETTLPHLGDYPANCLRSCLDRRLVLRPAGSIVHRLQGRLGRHRPESLVRGLTGDPVCSGAGNDRRHVPVNPPRNPVRHPTGNGGRDSSRNLRDYEPRRPSHNDRSLPTNHVPSSALGSMPVPCRTPRRRETPYVVSVYGRHTILPWGERTGGYRGDSLPRAS